VSPAEIKIILREQISAMGEQNKNKQDQNEQEIGTVRSRIAEETTGEKAPDADKGGTSGEATGKETDGLDSNSGAGGTTAGGGTSGVPT
jgi:hypothetical protein